VVLLAVFGVLVFQNSLVFADSSLDRRSILENLKQQMAKMQETIDAQNARIQHLEAIVPTDVPPSRNCGLKSKTADALPKIEQKIGAKDTAACFPWGKPSGDIRLRYEGFDYYNKNNDAGSTGTASDRTRNRFRVRLRFGLDKDTGDDWKVGFRIATGNQTDATSTNQTLGNSGYFTFKAINVDRVYAIYEPSILKNKGVLTGVKIGAGKFDNPFLRYSTGILWDTDVTPEGIYEQGNMRFVDTDNDQLIFQTTAGQFILNENAGVDTDAALFGYQAALNWTTTCLRMPQPVNLATAVSYYDYTNWFGTVKNNTTGVSLLRTNSIVADRFRVLDLYPEFTIHVKKDLPLTAWADYALNTANVGTEDVVQSGGNDIHDSDSAWGVGFKLGKAKTKSGWEFSYGYYEIGVNAVVAAFGEADYGGPGQNGYTNRKGHRLGLVYLITDSISLYLTGYWMRPLHPFDGNATIGIQHSTNEDVFRSQVDLVYKF